MRYLVLILFFFAGQAVMASWLEKRSWASIRNDETLSVVLPDLGGANMFDVCATETRFRSLVPVAVCTESKVTSREACVVSGELFGTCRPLADQEEPLSHERLEEHVTCTHTEIRKNVEYYRQYETVNCVRYEESPNPNFPAECLEYEDTVKVYSTEHNVPIWKMAPVESTPEFLGYKRFIIPTCAAHSK